MVSAHTSESPRGDSHNNYTPYIPQFVPRRGILSLDKTYFDERVNEFPQSPPSVSPEAVNRISPIFSDSQSPLNEHTNDTPTTVSTRTSNQSSGSKVNKTFLDYDHPCKLFPYAGIPGISFLDIPKATPKLTSRSRHLTSAFPNGTTTFKASKANKAEIFKYGTFRSVRARFRYCGPNRFLRQDIHYSILSTGYYFSSPDQSFTSEPVCLLFICFSLGLSFFEAICLSWFPIVYPIKPSPPERKARLKLFITSEKGFSSFFSKASRAFGLSKRSSKKHGIIVKEKEDSDFKTNGTYTEINTKDVGDSIELMSSEIIAVSKIGLEHGLNSFDLKEIFSQKPHIVTRYDVSASPGYRKGLEDILKLSPQQYSESRQVSDSSKLHLILRKTSLCHSLRESYPLQSAMTLHDSDRDSESSHCLTEPSKTHFFSMFLGFKRKRKTSKVKSLKPSSERSTACEMPMNEQILRTTTQPISVQNVPDYYRSRSVLEVLRIVIQDSSVPATLYGDFCREVLMKLGKSFLDKSKENALSRYDDIAFRKPTNQSHNIFESINPVSHLQQGHLFVPFGLQSLSSYRPKKYEKRLKFLESPKTLNSEQPAVKTDNILLGRKTSYSSKATGFQNEIDCHEENNYDVPVLILEEEETRPGSRNFSPTNGPDNACQSISDNDLRSIKISGLLSHFPVSASELRTAKSILEIPISEPLSPLHVSCIEDPVFALNLSAFSGQTDNFYPDDLPFIHNSSASEISVCYSPSSFERCNQSSVKSFIASKKEDIPTIKMRISSKSISNSAIDNVCKVNEDTLQQSSKGMDEQPIWKKSQNDPVHSKAKTLQNSRNLRYLSKSSCGDIRKRVKESELLNSSAKDVQASMQPCEMGKQGSSKTISFFGNNFDSNHSNPVKEIQTREEFLSDSEISEVKDILPLAKQSEASGQHKMPIFSLPREKRVHGRESSVEETFKAPINGDKLLQTVTEEKNESQNEVPGNMFKVWTKIVYSPPRPVTPLYVDPSTEPFTQKPLSEDIVDSRLLPLRIYTISESGQVRSRFFRNVSGVLKLVSKE